MRKWIIGIVVLLVAGFVVVPPLLRGATTSNAQSAETATVELTTLNTTVESTGTVMPAQTLSLNFGTGGTVIEVSGDVGDTVEVGQVLARLDTADLEYQVELAEQSLAQAQANYDNLIAPPTDQEIAQAQANLASARSQLANAQVSQDTAGNQITTSCANVSSTQRSLEQAQDAYDEYVSAGYTDDANFIPDPDSEAGTALTNAQNGYDVAQAQCNSATMGADNSAQLTSVEASVAQAQASMDSLMAGASAEQIAAQSAQLAQAQLQLENAQRALQDAQIVAPFAGVITSVPISVGQTVSAQTAAITVMDNSALYVDIGVDELDIVQVQIGQSATITLDATEGVELTGEVIRIAPTGSIDQGVVTYSVRVSVVPNEEARVLPGMTADVAIVVATIENALVVPTEAIQREGDQGYVLVVGANGQSQQVNVVSGETTDGLTVITGDLDDGQTIYLRVSEQEANGFGPPAGGSPFGGG
jgi:HlyD family secretion protein